MAGQYETELCVYLLKHQPTPIDSEIVLMDALPPWSLHMTLIDGFASLRLAGTAPGQRRGPSVGAVYSFPLAHEVWSLTQ